MLRYITILFILFAFAAGAQTRYMSKAAVDTIIANTVSKPVINDTVKVVGAVNVTQSYQIDDSCVISNVVNHYPMIYLDPNNTYTNVVGYLLVGPEAASPTERFVVNGDAIIDTNLTITVGNFLIPTTSATGGQILQDGVTIFHTYSNYTYDDYFSNIFLGQDAGNFTTDGIENIGFGGWALKSLTTGDQNIAIGHYTLNSLTEGNDNFSMGYLSMNDVTTANANIGIGNYTLLENITGDTNIAIGFYSQQINEDATLNTSVGSWSLTRCGGDGNSAFGHRSAFNTRSMDYVTSIGYASLSRSDTVSQSIYLGSFTGMYDTNITRSIFIGDSVGYDQRDISDELWIDNSPTPTPLIWGDFAADDLTINGRLIVTERIEEQEPDHFFFDYVVTGDDTIGGSSVGTVIATAARYIWAHMAPTLTDAESDGFSISNDTVTYTGTDNAHIKFEVTATFTAGNTEDWEVCVYNVTDGAIVPNREGRTTTGATNLTGVTVLAYDINADSNDKYVLKVRNLTNANDMTLFYLSWYGYVKHY